MTEPKAEKKATEVNVESASQRSTATSSKARSVSTKQSETQQAAAAASTSSSKPPSVHSSKSRASNASNAAGGGGSVRSVTSTEAFNKLQQLEQMLLEERKAREHAELTLVALQRERAAKDEAIRRSQQTQKHLNDVMGAVQRVVIQPNDATNIRKLQAILQGQYSGDQQETTSSRASTSSSVRGGEGRSFLDGIGQYERDKKKEKQREKMERSKQ